MTRKNNWKITHFINNNLNILIDLKFGWGDINSTVLMRYKRKIEIDFELIVM